VRAAASGARKRGGDDAAGDRRRGGDGKNGNNGGPDSTPGERARQFPLSRRPTHYVRGEEEAAAAGGGAMKRKWCVLCRSTFLLVNTILVRLELWKSVMVIIIFGPPQTYAYATLRQRWQVIRLAI
jgi:hypothetical protein